MKGTTIALICMGLAIAGLAAYIVIKLRKNAPQAAQVDGGMRIPGTAIRIAPDAAGQSQQTATAKTGGEAVNTGVGGFSWGGQAGSVGFTPVAGSGGSSNGGGSISSTFTP